MESWIRNVILSQSRSWSKISGRPTKREFHNGVLLHYLLTSVLGWSAKVSNVGFRADDPNVFSFSTVSGDMPLWPPSITASSGRVEDMLNPASNSTPSDTTGKCPSPSPSSRSTADLPLPVIQRPPSIRRRPPNPFGILTSEWTRFKEWRRESSIPLESCVASKETRGQNSFTHPIADKTEEECHDILDPNSDQSIVDEVVVDRSWSDDFRTSTHWEGDEASISYHSGRQHTSPPTSVHEESNHSLSLCQPLSVLWDHICLCSMEFFSSRFPDSKLEVDYQKEVWEQSKWLALWASTFFIANWVLGVAFILGPILLSDKIFYYGVSATSLFLRIPE